MEGVEQTFITQQNKHVPLCIHTVAICPLLYIRISSAIKILWLCEMCILLGHHQILTCHLNSLS